MALFHINKTLLPLKACYFLVFAGMACLLPYLPVYFVSLGVDVLQVGILRALDPILAFICTPFWGGCADKYGKHRLCLTVAIIGAIVFQSSFILVSYIAPSPQPSYDVRNVSECRLESMFSKPLQCLVDRQVTFTEFSMEVTEPDYVDFCVGACYGAADGQSQNQTLKMCSLTESIGENFTNWRCQTCDFDLDTYYKSDPGVQYSIIIFCQSPILYKSFSSDNSEEKGTNGGVHSISYMNNEVCTHPSCCKCKFDGMDNPSTSQLVYLSCLALSILGSVFQCNIPSYIDAATLGNLGEDQHKYGKQRLWGTVGFGLAGFASGLLVDAFTTAIGSSAPRYEPVFTIFAIMMTLLLLATFFVKLPQHRKPRKMSKNLLVLLRKPAVVMFLVVVAVQGASLGMTFSYLMIYWKDELGASLTLLGFSVFITTIAETPALYISGRVIDCIGYRGVVYLTLVAYAVRYLCYGLIRDPWVMLPVQLIHGINFGIGWPGFTMYANQIAPEGMVATLQSMKTSAHVGVGFIFGNLVGGFTYKHFGARHLFLGNAVLCIFTALVFFASEMVLGHHRQSEQEDPKEATSKDTSPQEGCSLSNTGEEKSEQASTKPEECRLSRSEAGVAV